MRRGARRGGAREGVERLLSFRCANEPKRSVDGGGTAGEELPPPPVPGGGFGSTLAFVDDGSVLPTYLSVEHGAGAALGALGLACADLFELRTGEAQRVTVSRTAAGLATAGYLFIEAVAR